MSLARFDDYGGFPRSARIFVLPEVGIAVAAHVELHTGNSQAASTMAERKAAHIDVLLRAYLEPREWVSFETLVRELALPAKRIQRALSRAWQAGLIERDIPKRRCFGPMVKRSYRWRKQGTAA